MEFLKSQHLRALETAYYFALKHDVIFIINKKNIILEKMVSFVKFSYILYFSKKKIYKLFQYNSNSNFNLNSNNITYTPKQK